MLRIHKSAAFILFLAISFASFAQSAADAISGWQVSSKRIAEGKYELSFVLPSTSGWQVYAPNQVFEEVKMASLQFPDSSIKVGAAFSENPEKTIISSPFFGEGVGVYEGRIEWQIPIAIEGVVPEKLSGTLQYSYGRGDEFLTGELPFTVSLEGGVKSNTRVKVASIDIHNPVNNCGDEGTQNKSILSIFLLGLAGGLIALLTPCVFPMVPVTVTFFTKKSQDKRKGVGNALLYGFFIFMIYVLITIPFHVAGNTSPEIFNNISTNVWLNLLFFAIFLAFALSFFGLYEIGLPSGLANKADSKSGLGNLGGIFFMAATLAIVSFSCTGPILGTLLVGVAEQGAWPLTAGAAGFGLALGLPFALFAMFPNWLQSLPKSGGWMTDVKVVLGFIELALAIKFLSNADLVQQWGLLKRELFIALWIIISVLIVLYLLGLLRIGHSSPVRKFSITRIAFITLFSLSAIYLILGLTTSRWAGLRLISGFPPPRTYSLFAVEHGANGVFEPIQNDYQLALDSSKKVNKPVLIDFTGWACVNCRRMEENIWPDPLVDSLMRTQFVVVSLYVDERRNLPLPEQTIVTLANGKEKSIVTVGDKWATYQTENFGATSQPQYAIITSDEKVLTRTKYYTDDADEFAEWLQCGLAAFGKVKNQTK